MRDYNKGKFLLESRPGQLVPIGGAKDGPPSADAQQQQKRILNKVWTAVEQTMGDMRNALLAQLGDVSKSIEEHEKTLEFVACVRCHDCPFRLTRCLQDPARAEHDGRAGLGVFRQPAQKYYGADEQGVQVCSRRRARFASIETCYQPTVLTML
jgi:hypothetical protein